MFDTLIAEIEYALSEMSGSSTLIGERFVCMLADASMALGSRGPDKIGLVPVHADRRGIVHHTAENAAALADCWNSDRPHSLKVVVVDMRTLLIARRTTLENLNEWIVRN